MTSLGFSEYAEASNNNNEPKSNIRRNGGVGVGGGGGRQNRTLKIPRSQETGPINSSTPNNGFSATTAGKKIKQIKDYIENIHRKGGEDSEEDPDDSSASSLLPAYPAQGMGIYASNVSHSGIIRGAETVSSKTSPVVRKTTQMNSLNPGSSYSSTLLEGMESAAPTMSNIESPYFEKLTGISGAPKKDAIAAGANNTTTVPFSTNAYATHYYEQFVPYAETLANQLASGGSGGGGGTMSGTNAALIEKLNYIIHMLEEKKDEKTGHVIEELVLYCFLGIFIIFVVDTFTHAAGGSSGVGGRGGSMFGGMMRRGAATQYYRR
jgi:hypothetical protein